MNTRIALFTIASIWASSSGLASDWIDPCMATITEDRPNGRLVCIARCTYGYEFNGIQANDVTVKGTMSGAARGACSGAGYCGMYDFASPYNASTTYSLTGEFTAVQMAIEFSSKTVSGSCTTQPPSPPQSSDNRCGLDNTYPCEQSESCPLILDLNSDGIHTTRLNDPVHYWIDLAGRTEATAWTDPRTEEAFLWIDLNDDHVAQVTELFGSRMVAPDGSYHPNGFNALAKYDRAAFGGDGDGGITQKDAVWSRLKLWVDRNHDTVSQPTEISVPSSHGIVALNLIFTDGEIYDQNGNELYLVGSYSVRVHGNATEHRLMADVEFRYIAN